MDIQIHCKYDELVDPNLLVDFGRNPNKHPPEQITRLAKLYQYQGVRHPIIVDKERNVIAAGHGRKYAAIEAGLDKFPIVFQSFEDEDKLYAFVVSDNAIGDWAELELARINVDTMDLGPDFDLDMLGIDGFVIEPADKEPIEKDQDEAASTEKECPACGHKWS